MILLGSLAILKQPEQKGRKGLPAGGTPLEVLLENATRGQASPVMIEGATQLLSQQIEAGTVHGVIGIGGTIGALGGMFMAKFTGWVLETTHSYALLFAIAASAYWLALLSVQLLSPRPEPAKFD